VYGALPADPAMLWSPINECIYPLARALSLNDRLTLEIPRLNSSKTVLAFIGEGKMLYECLNRALRAENCAVSLVITRATDDATSRRLVRLCSEKRVPLITDTSPNCGRSLAALRNPKPDYILNVNSFAILKQEVLAAPTYGIINFHNGPLPLYAGRNIPTWVIWNGESSHGVSWHFMDEGIDTGDIVAQSLFDVHPRTTAIALTVKCIMEGIRLFESVLTQILSGQVRRVQQRGPSSRFKGRDIPNDGYIDFSWPIARIDRLVRALDFHPLPNALTYPRVRLGDNVIRVNEIEAQTGSTAPNGCRPGAILTLRDEELAICAHGGRVVIRSFIDTEGQVVSVAAIAQRYALAPGWAFS
jgi:methionyl-tRNA formyltransferase